MGERVDHYADRALWALNWGILFLQLTMVTNCFCLVIGLVIGWVGRYWTADLVRIWLHVACGALFLQGVLLGAFCLLEYAITKGLGWKSSD